MATTQVTKNPSRKKSRAKLNASARKAKPTKIKSKATPVVDVPSNKDSDVEKLVMATSSKVEKYLKSNFDGVDQEMITLVTRECAECVVYQRTAKKHDAWDKEIIEEVILNCFPAVNENDEAEKPVAKKAAKKTTKKAAPRGAGSKKASAKKASAKKATSKKKVAKKASAKKTTKKKVAKKASAKKTTKASTKKVVSADLDTMKAEVKKAKGVKQFELACAVLKKEKKIWMQAQDIPMVASHLFNVHTGKEKLKEKVEGQGEKDYAKRRLVKTLDLIKELI